MATPASRVFVLYIETAADISSPLSQQSHAALHEVAKRGNSGFLVLPGSTNANTKRSDLAALLGVNLTAKTRMMPRFPFPDMPLAFISDSVEACETAEDFGIEDVQNLSEITSHAETSARILNLLRQEDPKAKQLVVFHLSKSSAEHWIFGLVETLLASEESDCLVSIVRTASRPHTVDPVAAAHPLRPRQSFERHDGTYSESPVLPPRRLLFSSHHTDRTRRDLVTSFTEEDIEANNAYGAMDARIFMKELAFRLGFAPKYGA